MQNKLRVSTKIAKGLENFTRYLEIVPIWLIEIATEN